MKWIRLTKLWGLQVMGRNPLAGIPIFRKMAFTIPTYFMKALLLFGGFIILCLNGFAQHPAEERVLTPGSSPLSVSTMKDGKYIFSYENGMTNKKDKREIVFANKTNARNFVSAIGVSIKSKDGSVKLFTYKNYSIRLLSELGSVFMIVHTTGLSQSTLRISKECYDQINNSVFTSKKDKTPG